MCNTKLVVAIAFLVLVGFQSNYAAADTRNEKAIELIQEAADGICGELLQIGSQDDLEIAGSAQLRLNNLIKLLADIGFEGDASLKSGEYINVKREELASELKNNRECRLEIWRDLESRFLVSGSAQESSSNLGNKNVTRNQSITTGSDSTVITDVTVGGDLNINN